MVWRQNSGGISRHTLGVSACAFRPRPQHYCFALILVAALSSAAQTPMPTGSLLRTDRLDMSSPINQPPGPNEQMQMRDQQSRQRSFEAANAERRRQIAADSTKLMKLAAEINTELEKDGENLLSPNVIRKANEIEKLAHDVKEKMKLSVGSTPLSVPGPG